MEISIQKYTLISYNMSQMTINTEIVVVWQNFGAIVRNPGFNIHKIGYK